MGMAIVTTRSSGSFIENEIHGLIVPPENPKAIADAVLRLQDDRDLAARLGRNAREEVFRSYTMKNLEGNILGLVESLV